MVSTSVISQESEKVHVELNHGSGGKYYLLTDFPADLSFHLYCIPAVIKSCLLKFLLHSVSSVHTVLHLM